MFEYLFWEYCEEAVFYLAVGKSLEFNELLDFILF